MTKQEMIENLQGLASDCDHEAKLIKDGEIVYEDINELMSYVETMIENNFDVSVSVEVV